MKSAFKEVFDFEGKHVIEFHAGFVEHTNTNETADQCIAFEETFGVLFVECEKLSIQVSKKNRMLWQNEGVPGSTTDFRQCELYAPDLSLVAETIPANNLQFGVAGELLGSTEDISRGKLMLSGQETRTDEQTRKLKVEVSTM